MEVRTPRPKPKIDFTLDALDYKNVTLLRQFVTDQGRILPRKYTGSAGPLSAAVERGDQACPADAPDEVGAGLEPIRLLIGSNWEPGCWGIHSRALSSETRKRHGYVAFSSQIV